MPPVSRTASTVERRMCFPMLTLHSNLPESQGEPQYRNRKLHAPPSHHRHRSDLSTAKDQILFRCSHSPAGCITSAAKWDLRSMMPSLNNEGRLGCWWLCITRTAFTAAACVIFSPSSSCSVACCVSLQPLGACVCVRPGAETDAAGAEQR